MHTRLFISSVYHILDVHTLHVLMIKVSKVNCSIGVSRIHRVFFLDDLISIIYLLNQINVLLDGYSREFFMRFKFPWPKLHNLSNCSPKQDLRWKATTYFSIMNDKPYANILFLWKIFIWSWIPCIWIPWFQQGTRTKVKNEKYRLRYGILLTHCRGDAGGIAERW